MVERNAGVAPDKRIEFRIGIHLGDVVEETDGLSANPRLFPARPQPLVFASLAPFLQAIASAQRHFSLVKVLLWAQSQP